MLNLRRRSIQNRLLMLAALVLIAGGIASGVAFGFAGSHPKPLSATPPPPQHDFSKVPKSVKFSTDAAKVAQKFIATNVVRKDLAEGYTVVGPDLKEGLTLHEWLSGNIPVIPYPATALGKIPIQVIYSYKNQALLRVFLLPRPGAKQQGATFWLTLQRVGHGTEAHWLVNGWMPYASTSIPSMRSN